jgi:hypothetical protein
MKKINSLVAASALAAAVVVGATAQSASAACGVSPEAHNRDGNTTAVVNWADSDVRIRTWIPLPFGLGYWQEGLWASVGTGSSTIPVGDTKGIAATLTFNCNVQRQYRFDVTENGSSRWVYYPSQTGWNTDNAPHFHV